MNGRSHLEVVVEPVLDRRAEADPGVGEELAYRGRHDVGRRVTEQRPARRDPYRSGSRRWRRPRSDGPDRGPGRSPGSPARRAPARRRCDSATARAVVPAGTSRTLPSGRVSRIGLTESVRDRADATTGRRGALASATEDHRAMATDQQGQRKGPTERHEFGTGDSGRFRLSSVAKLAARQTVR